MSKIPAFQFYPADWRKDIGVQSLSFHDRGVWFEILCIMHESERRGVLVMNKRAITDSSLSQLLGLDKQITTTTLATLLESGVASREETTGAIYCRRMVNDERIRQIRVSAGKQGGNPALVKQTKRPDLVKQITTTGVKQNTTPSSSPSGKKKPLPFDLPEWLPVDFWESFEEMRKKKRAPLTDRARNGVFKKLQDFHARGLNACAILEKTIINSWSDVYEPKENGNGHANGKLDKAAQAIRDAEDLFGRSETTGVGSVR